MTTDRIERWGHRRLNLATARSIRGASWLVPLALAVAAAGLAALLRRR